MYFNFLQTIENVPEGWFAADQSLYNLYDCPVLSQKSYEIEFLYWELCIVPTESPIEYREERQQRK